MASLATKMVTLQGILVVAFFGFLEVRAQQQQEDYGVDEQIEAELTAEIMKDKDVEGNVGTNLQRNIPSNKSNDSNNNRNTKATQTNTDNPLNRDQSGNSNEFNRVGVPSQGMANINININAGGGLQQDAAPVRKSGLPKSQASEDFVDSYDEDLMGGVRSLRDSRKKLEKQNEIKVVETLESARLEDEKKRAQKLSQGLFSNNEKNHEDVNEPVINNKAQGDFVDSALIENSSSAQSVRQKKRAIKEEGIADIEAQVVATDDHDYEPGNEVISGRNQLEVVLGLGDYPGVVNVRGQYSLGIQFGKQVRESIDVAGGFMFSEFDVEQRDGGWFFDPYYGWIQYPRITKMNQYQANLLVKYVPIRGFFEPYIGALVAYTYRTFSDVQFAIPNNDAQSHAIDFGFATGIKMAVSNDVSVGFDFRYFNNVYNRPVNSGLQRGFSRSVYRSDKAIESFNYTQLGLVGEFRF
ncbi:MAG: porin family protein [Bdellovibrionaceae bacterium]|nr:porin family protein [Pseudobdellovibrionaceae bacterium]MDW8190431.1 hypothetical protein [Pseudobdellovibrionaceae bacterium]